MPEGFDGSPGAAVPSGDELQFLHSDTPRKLQMRQMKVPQFVHGYPSDARSSRPHARQIIASRSFSSVIGASAQFTTTVPVSVWMVQRYVKVPTVENRRETVVF